MKPTIEGLLEQIGQTKKAQDEGVKDKDKLSPHPASRLSKNVETEAEVEGDPKKVKELVEAIQKDEGAKQSAEALLQAKVAEQMADYDQEIILKQAGFFGEAMADAFQGKLAALNTVNEKQAAEAEEHENERYRRHGYLMAEGYMAKIADIQDAVEEGVLDPSKMTTTSVNQEVSEEATEKALDNLSKEIAKEVDEKGEGIKGAAEKEASSAGIIKHHLRKLLSGASGKAIRGSKAVENAAKTVVKSPVKHPYIAVGSLAGAGVVGYGAHALRSKSKDDEKNAAAGVTENDVWEAYKNKEIDKEAFVLCADHFNKQDKEE